MSARTRRRYSEEFRANAVRKMSAPGQSVQELAEELGISPSLLFRWRRNAGTRGSMPQQENDKPKQAPRRPQDWTSEDKLAVVLAAQGLTQEQLGGFLRQRGLHQVTLDEWRDPGQVPCPAVCARAPAGALHGARAPPRPPRPQAAPHPPLRRRPAGVHDLLRRQRVPHDHRHHQRDPEHQNRDHH